MIEYIFKPIKATLYKKSISPLFVALAISWSIWNYKTILIIFSSMDADKQITYIESSIYGQSWLLASLQLGVFPLITAILFILIYPHPARWIYEYSHKQQKKFKKIKQKIKEKDMLEKEESRENIRIENDHDEKLTKRNDEIDRLKGVILSLENEIKEESMRTHTNQIKLQSDHDEELNKKITEIADINAVLVSLENDIKKQSLEFDKMTQDLNKESAPNIDYSLSDEQTEELVAKYFSPTYTGTVNFDYSNNDGRYFIGIREFLFELYFAKSSDKNIQLLNDPASIKSVAVVKNKTDILDIVDASAYDTSSRFRRPNVNQIAVLQNINGFYAAIKILNINDDTRGAKFDEITFDYAIQTNGSPDFTSLQIDYE